MMIFEIYNGVSDLPERELTDEENELHLHLLECLTPFPVHRIRIRKNYSVNINEISIDVELDSTLTSEKIYNKIVSRVFKALDIDLITLQNNGNFSNFPYFFYGEKKLFDYQCSIFLDVPKKTYFQNKSQLR